MIPTAIIEIEKEKSRKDPDVFLMVMHVVCLLFIFLLSDQLHNENLSSTPHLL